MSGPPSINVIADTRALRTKPFIVPDEHVAQGPAWTEWLEGIEREFRFFRITEEQDKADAIIIFGGPEINRLSRSLPDPKPRTGVSLETVYDKLKCKLNDHFLPKKNKHHARYLFLKLRPNEGEATTTYAARLREKSKDCEFDNNDERILEHLIQTVESKVLIQKAINKAWNLDQFISEAGQMEDIAKQVTDMKDDKKVAKIQGQDRSYSKPGDQRKKYGKKKYYKPPQQHASKLNEKPYCDYCGQTGVHARGRNCPAYGKLCKRCFKRNHFTSVCKNSQNPSFRRVQESHKGSNFKPRRQRNQVRKTQEYNDQDDTDSTSSDGEYFEQTGKHLQIKHLKKINSREKTLPVHIGNVRTWVEPDTGADVNLMDEHQFKGLNHRSTEEVTLQNSNIELHDLQKQLPVKGEFKTMVRNETCGIVTKFIVIEGKMNSPPLLCRQTLLDLGMMKIQPDGSLATPNEFRVKLTRKEGEPNTEMEKIIKKFDGVFEGIGKIRDIKNNKEFYASFPMKADTTPIAQKPRQIPFYLKEPLEKWLRQGIEKEIFEPVPEGEPITWCSPLVVQPKPRFTNIDSDKLQPHMIRASIDLRVPNKSMERTRVIQAPIVEDFVHKFYNCNVWSKLDLTQGYHQLVLDPKSRSVATFSTPWGNMRPKRLPFGAKASQDLFDEAIYRIFSDIPQCLNQRDDILIGGKNMEEHNKALEAVLQRAADFGITFNREKCEFGTKKIEFYGYIVESQKAKQQLEVFLA